MRYLPLTDADRKAMLERIGVADIDALFADIPADKRLNGQIDLPRGRGEMEVERELSRLAARNVAAGSVPFFVGAGAYKHHVPATVDHLIQRSEFLTSYTPYQPEIAQGTLQYLFEFQTQVALLAGLEVANASMYDGSTAAAEAVLMAHRITRRHKAVLAGNLHPHYRETIETVARLAGHEVVALPPAPEGGQDVAAAIDAGASCVVVQSPDFYGHLHDLRPLAEKAHAAGALLVAVVTEAVSLGLVESPGAMGADIFAGEGQSIGNALAFGGPYVGLFATRQRFVRQMPGRLAGETVDKDGRRGFVLTLSTREQHIRREKATSNICTNQGLMALAAAVYLATLGKCGLDAVARLCWHKSHYAAKQIDALDGFTVLSGKPFFKEFAVKLPAPVAQVNEFLLDEFDIVGGYDLGQDYPHLKDHMLIAVTETNTQREIDDLIVGLKEAAEQLS